MFFAFSLTGYAQKIVSKNDSIPLQKLTSYEKLIPGNSYRENGLFHIKNNQDKWYFEIPDTLLNRYILTITRYSSTAQGMGNFGGEKVNEQTVYFEKGPAQKIFLRAAVYRQDVKNENQDIFKAVINSQENPIVAAFDIKSINPTTGDAVIEVTDFFRKDNNIVSISSQDKTDNKLGSLADDRSFIENLKSYPINVEIKTTKTYNTSAGTIAAGALTGNITLKINTSMVLLPKIPMRKRFADERVGYFNNKYILFDEDRQRAETKYFIQRYRLEPREEDIEKYKKGKLVEPKKQIVYYIDPATPKKWRPYLIAGINDWQKAFEQAGFKNAIVGKEWPETDSTMSLEDARFSVIRYYASEKPNAYGPRISDPRSGEIIESHVGWYHNVMKLLQSWYMIQAGAIDPRARKMNLDDQLMGDLIRFVSSHEIGHTLGLTHNMGASSQTPVEKLRDKKWVEANGHTVSIMDYARFNYVAQPEDNISSKGIYPRIGAYDKWAIEWGYRLIFGSQDEFEDQKILNKLIIDSLTTNPKLWFGGEGKDENPASQAEDLGDDAIKASDYGIKNLKRIVPNLTSWTKEDGDLYNNLQEMHAVAVRQFSRYLYHVMKNVGSRYVTKRSTDQKGDVYEEVPKEKVKSAIDYVGRQVFDAPLWLYPKEITSKINVKPMDEISNQQNQMLLILLSPGMLYNIQQKALTSSNPYSLSEYLDDVSRTTWTSFDNDIVKNTYKRALQRSYIEKLNMLINPKDVQEGKLMSNDQRSDGRLEGLRHLEHISVLINKIIPSSESIDSIHLNDMLLEIEKIQARAKKN